ncbi:MAG TPA: transglycosylase SLT domain-containing protein, partial [Thermodesulfovibrionales bacterium]|nr:transglycosylase SLT domain-containing protein [Thermodesulfovibrionales bacterium]
MFALLCSSPAAALDSKAATEPFLPLGQGKDLLEKGTYPEAVEKLKIAYGELPVIRDYTLFFMARAYNGMGSFKESSACTDELLASYSSSPLRKKARALQIRNVFLSKETAPLNRTLSGIEGRDSGMDAALRTLEAYVGDYPEDIDMTFFLAELLKKLGNADRAKRLFALLYSGNSSYSEQAFRELQPPDITPELLFARVSSLMKAMEYKKAESVLRKLLPLTKGALREEAQKTLGLSLFRQKRYKEASDEFLRGGDLYNSARSLYRAGELTAFRETVSRLISMEDKRAGSLLIAFASRKRREGRPEESMTIYDDIRKRYPSLVEEALWGMAWTQFRKGDYKNATALLTELNEKYPSSRYLYWKQRSAERDDPDNATLRKNDEGQAIKGFKKDFYRLLAYAHDRDSLNGRAFSNAQWSPLSDSAVHEHGVSAAETPRLPFEVLPLYERFTILLAIGMKEEATSELVRIANGVSSPEALMDVCRTLQDLGAYKKSITLIARLYEEKGARRGDRMDIDDILYPMAYWSTVSEVSDRYGIDPFVLLAVMREESRFDPAAHSVAGALGLMQIMPQTAHSLDKHLKMEISDNSE